MSVPCRIFAADMDLRLITVLVLAVVGSAGARAQLRGIVVDLSTGVPQRDVIIFTNHNEVDTTDWKGEYVFSEPFEWAEARHPRFLSRRMTAEEMRDTVGLIPLVNELSEVVVTARRIVISPGVFAGLGGAVAAGAAEAPHGIVSFDFFAPLARFDKSRRWVSKKERRHQKEVLDNY